MMFKCGDIFLSDSKKAGAQIAKFFMIAPTVWHYIWRWMRGTQQEVRYYHAGMILSDMELIEQQGKVQIDSAFKILPRDVIVYRKKNLSITQEIAVKVSATMDLGKGFDLVLIIGKTLTWLTGIRFFTDLLGWLSRNEEICITRVAAWYEGIEDFGVEDHAEVTTKIVDEYCAGSPDWEVVYRNERET